MSLIAAEVCVVGEGSQEEIEYLIGWPVAVIWLNRHLCRAKMHIKNLSTGIRDGVVLCTLVDILIHRQYNTPGNPNNIKGVTSVVATNSSGNLVVNTSPTKSTRKPKFEYNKLPYTKGEALANLETALNHFCVAGALIPNLASPLDLFNMDIVKTLEVMSGIMWKWRAEPFGCSVEELPTFQTEHLMKVHSIPISSIQVVFPPFDPKTHYHTTRIVAYTTNFAFSTAVENNCRKLLTMLDAKKVKYEEKNLSVLEATGRLREMEEIKLRLKNYTGVGAGSFPLLECDGIIIGDYDVVQELEDHGGLDDFLTSYNNHPAFLAENHAKMTPYQKLCRVVGTCRAGCQLLVTGEIVDQNWGLSQYQWYAKKPIPVAPKKSGNESLLELPSSLNTKIVSEDQLEPEAVTYEPRKHIPNAVSHLLTITEDFPEHTVFEVEVRRAGACIGTAISPPILHDSPRIVKIGLSGKKCFTSKIEVVYKYTGGTEGASVIQWYRGGGGGILGDSKELFAIPGANNNIYQPTVEDFKATWLCVEITPVREVDGVRGLTARAWVPRHWLSMDEGLKGEISEVMHRTSAAIPITLIGSGGDHLREEATLTFQPKNLKLRQNDRTITKIAWNDRALAWELLPYKDRRLRIHMGDASKFYICQTTTTRQRDLLFLLLQSFRDLYNK